MELYRILSGLLVVTALFAYLNHRLLRLPSAIGLMVLALLSSLLLIGLAKLGVPAVLSIVETIRKIDFNTILMQVMLSFLLFAGSIHLDASSLGRQWGPVLALSTLGTLLSTVFVGTAMYLVLPLFGLPTSFIYCLLFGGLISPTDPIAVMGILKEAGIPKPLEIRIVGESLFNDGVAVVVFATIFGIASSSGDADPSLASVLLLLGREAVGGMVLGAVLGYGAAWLIRSINQYQVEVLITLALVTGGYSLAAYLHTSGPLAMVMAGIIVGHQGRRSMSDVTREYVDKFWELVDEILNALLFVLIGLEMLVFRIEQIYLVVGLCAVVLVLVARLVSVSLPLALLRFRPHFADHSLSILTWGGLRGGISVALALSLPETMPRDLLVGITYVIVVFSIIVQGLSIGPLVKRLGLSSH